VVRESDWAILANGPSTFYSELVVKSTSADFARAR